MMKAYYIYLFLWCVGYNNSGCCQAKKEVIVEVPNKGKWSWISQWIKPSSMGKEYFQVCDVSSASEPSKWIRSNEFLVGDAKRIDVTIQNAVYKCSSVSLAYCKEYLKLFIYKTSIKHVFPVNAVPEPWRSPGIYSLFGTTSPTNLTTGSLSRNLVNTETYSFLTDKTKPYHYLAIQYQGGCFNLYSVSISYSVCPSLALPTGLIQLPLTFAPVNGTVQVPGSCTNNSQSSNISIALYGICQSNGEWSNQPISGECMCKAGFGKYLKGSGAFCDDCPSGTFQDSLSRKPCKSCPLNSLQNEKRKKCDCAKHFYRTKDETTLDNCTGQPSAPRNLSITHGNATSASIQWSSPSYLGGRGDQYYVVECYQCSDKQTNCTGVCQGSQTIHSPTSIMKATVKDLLPYTHYHFKVVAKNGVSYLAEKDGHKSKFASVAVRTKESVPGAPEIQTPILVNSTAFLLSWSLPKPNGVIIFYQVAYYPRAVGTSAELTLNTTKTRLIITRLTEGMDYIFQVRAATSVGLGAAAKVIGTSKTSKKSASTTNTDATVPILASLLSIALICVVILFVYLLRRRCPPKAESQQSENDEMTVNNSTRSTIVLDDVTWDDDGLYAFVLDETLWEIPRTNLFVVKKLGDGNFGQVDKAIGIGLPGHPGQVKVAVKSLKENVSEQDRQDFVTELRLMMRLEPHPRVVKLLGCCTKPDGPMCIVLEYLPYGNLLSYLRSSRGYDDDCSSDVLRPEGKLTSNDLIMFAWMIADGMSFLAQNKCVHRDLAARNVLVGEGKLCKISDLGLARKVKGDVYTRSKAARLPIKWMPPESIFRGESTIASDVWSYGIVLWEIFTLGDSPYPGHKGGAIPRLLEQGYRMPKPLHLSSTLYSLMLKCWQDKPEDRPSFSEICEEINAFFLDTKDYIQLFN